MEPIPDDILKQFNAVLEQVVVWVSEAHPNVITSWYMLSAFVLLCPA